MQERKNRERVRVGPHLSVLPPLLAFLHIPGLLTSPNLKDFTKSQVYMAEQVMRYRNLDLHHSFIRNPSLCVLTLSPASFSVLSSVEPQL